jgi:hypothetical protein
LVRSRLALLSMLLVDVSNEVFARGRRPSQAALIPYVGPRAGALPASG